MKTKLALLSAPIVMLAASTAMAANFCGVTPYVGADAELRYMNFQRDFGSNLFSHNYPQGNLYAGVQINDYLAVEAGYETTERKTRAVSNTGPVILTGQNIAAGNTIQSNTTSRVQGLHANILGFLPICEQYRLKLIGLLGFAHLNSKFVRTDVTTNGIPTNVNDLANATRTFSKRRNVLRLGAGLQHMINCNWGVRAMLKWEQTNRLKMLAVENQNFILNAKNSFIYSIGAFYTFN